MKSHLMTAAVTLATPGLAMAADVSIEIAGVKSADGPLYVSLQTEGQFMQNAGTAGKIVQDPQAGTISVVVPGVAPGEYSVSVWHDIDGDGQFDRAPDGRPLDGWSMLNAGALRGAPTFDAVKFSVSDSGAAIRLDMMYAE